MAGPQVIDYTRGQRIDPATGKPVKQSIISTEGTGIADLLAPVNTPNREGAFAPGFASNQSEQLQFYDEVAAAQPHGAAAAPPLSGLIQKPDSGGGYNENGHNIASNAGHINDFDNWVDAVKTGISAIPSTNPVLGPAGAAAFAKNIVDGNFTKGYGNWGTVPGYQSAYEQIHQANPNLSPAAVQQMVEQQLRSQGQFPDGYQPSPDELAEAIASEEAPVDPNMTYDDYGVPIGPEGGGGYGAGANSAASATSAGGLKAQMGSPGMNNMQGDVVSQEDMDAIDAASAGGGGDNKGGAGGGLGGSGSARAAQNHAQGKGGFREGGYVTQAMQNMPHSMRRTLNGVSQNGSVPAKPAHSMVPEPARAPVVKNGDQTVNAGRKPIQAAVPAFQCGGFVPKRATGGFVARAGYADGGMVLDNETGAPPQMGPGSPMPGGAKQPAMDNRFNPAPQDIAPDGVTDNQPIMADEGEYVIQRQSAQILGPDILNALNNPQMAASLRQIFDASSSIDRGMGGMEGMEGMEGGESGMEVLSDNVGDAATPAPVATGGRPIPGAPSDKTGLAIPRPKANLAALKG